MNEPEKPTVREKLRALAAASPEEAARRRSPSPIPVSPAMRKIIRMASALADRITEEDREESIQVIRDAMRATKKIYDPGTRTVIEYPDHLTRLAAVALLLAYDEGLPVQRVMASRAESETMEETLARLRASPEAMKAIAGLQAAGLKIAIGDEVIDVEAMVERTPKPG